MSSWYIKSVDDLHENVDLKPNEVVSLGRTCDTGIQDKDISRLHTLFKYQPAKETVICKHLGRHPAVINGVTLTKDMKIRVGLQSTIQLLAGRYNYIILDKAASGTKRKLTTVQHKGDSETLSPPNKRQLTSNQVPSNQVPSNQVPSNQVPSNQVPSNQVPTNQVPSTQSTSKNTPSSCTRSSNGPISSKLKEMLLKKLLVEPPSQLSQNWFASRDIIVWTDPGCKGRAKIAGFDLDHTVITTKSGKVFPTDNNDWEIMWPHKALPKLTEYYNNGYKIVILSNQNGILRGKQTVQGFQDKVSAIIKKLPVPVQVLAAPGNTATRKPCPGMWTALEKYYNDNIPIDYPQSLYVGDAAGRRAAWEHKKKKDFSSSDREFASNVGIKFYTPEAFFLGHKETDKWDWRSFDSQQYLTKQLVLLEGGKSIMSHSQEVVLIVGYPGSGKSHVSKTLLEQTHGYARVNMDDMKKVKVCVDVMEAALRAGTSVVADNTFPDTVSRNKYVSIAQKYKVPVRCFVMATTLEHAKHNNRFRRITGRGEEVPGIVYNTFKSRYQEPVLSEGFSDVVRVNFVGKFSEGHLKELYSMFLGS